MHLGAKHTVKPNGAGTPKPKHSPGRAESGVTARAEIASVLSTMVISGLPLSITAGSALLRLRACLGVALDVAALGIMLGTSAADQHKKV